MKFICSFAVLAAGLLVAISINSTFAASVLESNGVAVLRAATTNLNGAGIRIAQPEASADTNLLDFELDPNDGNIAQPTSLITYISANGSATNYPNSVGSYSGHASQVASFLFGHAFGVATNVSHVDNYDADYFVDTYIYPVSPPVLNTPIVNQSFIMGPPPGADAQYDFVAARDNILFVSGIGNGGGVNSPATCYNGLGVAAFGGASSIGPTPDNGRCKPDITAPAPVTSFSTPQVAGAAAVLMQAGLRGDGGNDTNAAVDIRTIKALLLNGAIKPANWTNDPVSAPLDARYGAGVLNVFNSYRQLAGGKHANMESVAILTGGAHPPTGATGTVSALSGWDCAIASSSLLNDGVNHYYFNVTNSPGNAPFTATATLVWNRQQSQIAINDLDLFLYDCATSNLVAQSISFVNNTEHLYVPALPPGRYDLQVWKGGSTPANGNITPSETYALAWEFFTMPLSISAADTNAVITWPIYPDGFALQASPLLSPPAWNSLSFPRMVTNGSNRVEVPLNSSNQFFRLRRTN